MCLLCSSCSRRDGNSSSSDSIKSKSSIRRVSDEGGRRGFVLIRNSTI